MSSAPIETTNFFWQLDQFGRRIGEWLEVLFAPVMRNNRLPDWSLPEGVLRGLFWVVTLGLIGWGVWQLYTLLRPYLMTNSATGSQQASQAELETRLPAARWFDRSRTFARQGNYREACRCLYYAALQQLDETRLIPQERSRTDGEYQSLVRSVPHAHAYQVLIATHEQLCFGSQEVSAQEFDLCQQAYREILTGNELSGKI